MRVFYAHTGGLHMIITELEIWRDGVIVKF